MAKIDVMAVAERKGSAYPEPYRQKAKGRLKRRLGDAAGLTDFGVNRVRLPPGEWSSQRHWHTHEDEFVYVIEGELTLITDAGEQVLRAGDCAGFAKNRPDGHHLINKSANMAIYLEVGSRHAADICEYPDIDMRLVNGRYVRKSGDPYTE
jgi:uncharacterized cupin superfamily protein